VPGEGDPQSRGDHPDVQPHIEMTSEEDSVLEENYRLRRFVWKVVQENSYMK